MSTHQQLLYHVVFSTKNRKPYLTDGFREQVFAYMAGAAKQLDGFALKIGGYDDHVHLLVRIPAKIARFLKLNEGSEIVMYPEGKSKVVFEIA